MADWASLPHDLLILTAGLLKKFEDFAAFGTVCKTWHAAANKELWLRQRTPYLLLPARRKGNDEVRDLYSWSEGDVVASIRVSNSSNKRKYFESLGWLLAIGNDRSLCLLDPFNSKVQIPLPPLPFKHHPSESVGKMVLSARPDESSDFIVAIVDRWISGLAFWRPGETSWSIVNRSKKDRVYYLDLTYHSGLFYSIDFLSEIRIHNFVEGNPPDGQLIATSLVSDCKCSRWLKPLRPWEMKQRCIYLTKTDEDSLLLVIIIRRYREEYDGHYIKTFKFEVYDFDFPTGKWRVIDNLGNTAIFVSNVNATTAVDASRFHGVVKSNHIYFMDVCHPYEGDNSMDGGTFNMENKTIDPFCHPEEFHSKTSRPIWFIPMLWPLSS